MPKLSITKADIAKEKLRRARERTDDLQARFSPDNPDGFWEFCKYLEPDFFYEKKAPLKELCVLLQRVYTGEIKKVLISVKRRFGKSRACDLLIAWILIYDGEATFMRNCYSAPLALHLSKRVMDKLITEKYQLVAPHIKLDPKESSKEGWKVLGNSITTYFGTGIDGSIIGKGCKTIAFLDDPIKTPEEAMNPSFIDKLETFIEGVHNTCIEPNSGCAQIIISTRWSKDDPIGQRIDDPDWESFIFPALDENDKSFCEEIDTTENLLAIRNTWRKKGMGWLWDAMYQCQPVDDLMSKINKERLKRFRMKDLPDYPPDSIVAFIDYANKGSDYLSMPIAHVYGGDKYIVDTVFSSEDSGILKPYIVEKITKHIPNAVTCESNQGGQEFFDDVRQQMEHFLNEHDIQFSAKYTTTNKEIRILVRIGEIIESCHFLERDEQDAHYMRFFDNLVSYGRSRAVHDDAADSMAGLLGMLSSIDNVQLLYFTSDSEKLDTVKANVFDGTKRYEQDFEDYEEDGNDDDSFTFFII